MIELANLHLTCFALPCQFDTWEGETKDGQGVTIYVFDRQVRLAIDGKAVTTIEVASKKPKHIGKEELMIILADYIQ